MVAEQMDLSDPSGFDADFRVLVVCTGNICRSPAAEFLLREAASDLGYRWSVTSAGLGTRGGRPMHVKTEEYLVARQVPVSTTWRSQAISPAHVERSDLVLTATREQADAVVGLLPTAIMRVFPLRQFARLVLAEAPESGLILSGDDLLERVNAARTRVASMDPVGDDIVDPMRRSDRFYRKRFAEIDEATRDIASRLAAR